MLATHEQILQTVKKSKHVLLTCRQDPHIDSLSSCLSLYLFLKKLDISSDVVITGADHAVEKCSFLPAASTVTVDGLHLKRLVIRLSRPGSKVGNFHYDVDGDALNIYITPSSGHFEPSDVRTEFGALTYDLIITCDTPDLSSLG